MPSADDICVSVAPAVSPPVFGPCLDNERIPVIAATGGETAGATKTQKTREFQLGQHLQATGTSFSSPKAAFSEPTA
jgi:hypothetical protein